MGIVRYEFSFPAANGGHKIYSCFWQQEGRQTFRAVIQIAHGMSEHILRYQEFACYLAKKGYLVCGNDHAGHGQSVEEKEEYGYFGEENGIEFLISDMYTLMDFMKRRFHGLPYILLGHSMGSFLVRKFIVCYENSVKGAIFLGTSGGSKLIDLAIKLSDVGIEQNGPKKKGHMVNELAFKPFNLRFHPIETEFDWLSRDKKKVKEFIEDEKCGFVFTDAGYRDLFLLLKSISTKKWAASVPKNLPMLLLSGDCDPVGGYGKGVKKVWEELKKAGCRNVTLKLYKEGRHEILNELNRCQVYQYLFRWLERNCIG